MIQEQIPLGLRLNDGLTFDSFYTPHSLLLNQLRSLSSGTQASILLVGESGSGKSHLLQACANDFSRRGLPVVYIPLRDFHQFETSIFESLEQMQLVCIDDVQCIAGDRVWEEALFHLYNRLRERGVSLLLSANDVAGALKLCLPDLVSRLQWGLVLQIPQLSDNDKIRALQHRSRLRGMDLSDELGEYLMRRYPRNPHRLFALLEQLDKASMVSQRKLTIPFVREYLNRAESHEHGVSG